jgi:hypothetical protein
MNSYISFFIYGHKNITSKHKTTLEFTKDKDLTLKGDCIVGVNSDFTKEMTDKIINFHKVRMEFIYQGKKMDSVDFFTNKSFCDTAEIVIRKSDFISDRTLGTRSTKSSAELNKQLKHILKDPSTRVKVLIRSI